MMPRLRLVGFRPLPMLLLVVTLIAIALGGCSDDDDNPVKPPDNPGPTVASTPENTLALYVAAYEVRDSMAVKSSFDSTYTGSSVDLNNLGAPINLVYDDEIRHVAALASTPGLTVFLDLGPSSTWTRMPSDDPSHPEWAVITISGSAFRVEITEGGNSYGAIGEPGTFEEFAFAPELDSASPTDTLWRIVRWRETGNSAPRRRPEPRGTRHDSRIHSYPRHAS